MTAPPLSVCIPTYKRPDQLRRCLESILRSAGEVPVPVHVVDDSTDDTNVAVIREFQARHPQLVHHRNGANLGIDRNIVHSVDVCDSRYAWILGEDDRLLPEAIPTVLDLLEREAPAFICVNYASVDADVAIVLKERSLDAPDGSKPAAEFLASDSWSMGFIGACVVDRARWGTVDHERYVGTYYAHVGSILESIHDAEVRIVSSPLVLNRSGAVEAFTWADSTFDVLHGWARMVDLLRRAYPADDCDRAVGSFRRAHGIGTLPFFAYLRAGGALDARVWARDIRRGPYPALSRTAAALVAVAPRAPLRLVRLALARVRRVQRRRFSDPGA